VDQQHVLERRRAGLDNLSRLYSSFSQKLVAHQFKLAYGKNVARANIGVVAGCVKDLHSRVVEILKDFSRKGAKIRSDAKLVKPQLWRLCTLCDFA
jgi:hypothetical protein